LYLQSAATLDVIVRPCLERIRVMKSISEHRAFRKFHHKPISLYVINDMCYPGNEDQQSGLSSWQGCKLQELLLYQPPRTKGRTPGPGSRLCCLLHNFLLYQPPRTRGRTPGLSSRLCCLLHALLLYPPPGGTPDARQNPQA
jgi:hypothetical protein